MIDSEGLAKFVQAELQAAHIPGCSLAVVDREGIIWAGAFGYADLQQRRPPTPATAYHLFSGTKLYTATAVMQLVEGGALALDAPVSHYLTGLNGVGQVTLKQLLSHTSGLKDTLKAFLAVHFDAEPAPTTAAALRRYQLKLKGRPGAKVEYCNANYALLGEIISRVTGQPYADYVTAHILQPLQMPVAFSLTEAMKADAATGYMRRWEPMRWLFGAMMPATARKMYGAPIDGYVALKDYDLDTAAIGGLVGSVLGFAPFVRAWLNEGLGLLTPASSRLMLELVAPGQAGIASKVGMGLGWKIGQSDQEPFVNHEGGGAGFTSETRLYPARGLGLVLCLNRMSIPHINLVAHRICEQVRRAIVPS